MTGFSQNNSMAVSLITRLRNESGSVLVEFAIVISLFFFLFFAAIDLGRLFSSFVLSESGTDIAIRIAVVREPACAGVPDRHTRGPAVSAPRFGTSCSFVAGTCADVGTITCAGVATNATAAEIWGRIKTLMPNGTTIPDLKFSYSFDPNLGFLGGPYTPMVTVFLNPPPFQFISPLGGLASAAGASNPGTLGSNITYPTFSVSLPGEDLALGDAG